MNVYNESLDPAKQLFSPARWWLLMTLHWAENRRRYLLALLAIAGALFAWYSFLLVMDRDDPMGMKYQFPAYYIGLILIGCLYGSMLFSELGHKTRGIQYLSIPASLFEKLLCALFFGVLLFFIAYTLLFYLVDIPMVGLANRVMSWNALHMHHNQRPVGYPAVVYNVFANEGAPMDFPFNVFLVEYFAIQAAFILGSVYFPRYSFVKTVVSLLLCCLVFMLFMIKGIAENLPQGWHIGSSLTEWSHWNVYVNEVNERKLIRSPSWVGDSLLFLVKYCIPLIFWSITYTRLKEKEV
jgi:hypothetical protein